MLKRKKVFISDVHRLKVFYPTYRVVRGIPILTGDYIYVGDGPWDFDRFPRSIWVSRTRPEVYLDKVENVVELLGGFKKLTVGVKERFLASKDLEECWRKVTEYYYFGILQEEEIEEQVYRLFAALSSPNKDIFEIYSKLKLPRPVVLSSLLTMVAKAQSYKDYQGSASSNYIRLLYQMNRSLKDVKQKFVSYWLSDQSELQFLNLLFSLKR